MVWRYGGTTTAVLTRGNRRYDGVTVRWHYGACGTDPRKQSVSLIHCLMNWCVTEAAGSVAPAPGVGTMASRLRSRPAGSQYRAAITT